MLNYLIGRYLYKEYYRLNDVLNIIMNNKDNSINCQRAIVHMVNKLPLDTYDYTLLDKELFQLFNTNDKSSQYFNLIYEIINVIDDQQKYINKLNIFNYTLYSIQNIAVTLVKNYIDDKVNNLEIKELYWYKDRDLSYLEDYILDQTTIVTNDNYVYFKHKQNTTILQLKIDDDLLKDKSLIDYLIQDLSINKDGIIKLKYFDTEYLWLSYTNRNFNKFKEKPHYHDVVKTINYFYNFNISDLITKVEEDTNIYMSEFIRLNAILSLIYKIIKKDDIIINNEMLDKLLEVRKLIINDVISQSIINSIPKFINEVNIENYNPIVSFLDDYELLDMSNLNNIKMEIKNEI